MRRVDLHNKSIVITGASSGIGRATAIACAQAGMRVVVSGRREGHLDEVVRKIEEVGGEALAFPADVTDASACESLIDFTIDRLGACDALFANAGVTLGEPTHRTSDDKLREIFDINLFGSMNAVRPAIVHMLGRNSGHVLLCSSCLSLVSVPNHGAYTATKAAQHHMVRAMRTELHGSGIHVSSVHPIGTRTELFDAARQKHGDYTAHNPPSFMMQPPERVAKAVVKCLRRPKPEVWTSCAARIVMALSNATPRLTDRIVRTMMHATEE